MQFHPSTGALVAYAAGRVDQAADLAREILARDPNAADAHLCLALLAIRRGDENGAIEALRNCARLRSAEWILAQLRADASARGAHRIGSGFALRLGGFLRSHLTSLGPVLEPEHRRGDHPFVNVIGTSYVRSFGSNTALFPLFIGMGPTMLLLTETAAALTRRKFAANMQRLDGRRDTLLVVGGDAFYHVRNILKTRADPSEQPTEADFALMRVVADRHAGILEDARKHVSGRLYLLGSTPTFSPLVDALGLRLNDELARVCKDHDVELLDCWEALADPQTGLLRADYSANAYPGDIHYSLATVPIFIEALKARGSLPADTPAEASFEWSSVFECEIDKAERTRIWSEPSVSPNNAFKSDKIAATHLGVRVAELMTFLAASDAGRTVAMINVRDGHAPISLPPQVTGGCLAVTDCRANREAAQMTLDFFGRTDVTLCEFGPEALRMLAGNRFWGTLLMIHPDSADADEERCNQALEQIGGSQLLFVATAYPDRLGALKTGGKKVLYTLPLSNRHIPPKWANYSLAVMA